MLITNRLRILFVQEEENPRFRNRDEENDANEEEDAPTEEPLLANDTQ